MTWRADLINGDTGVKSLFEHYEKDRKLDGKPIRIVTIADRFTLPAKTSEDKLPMVSFGYGSSKPLGGGATEAAREEFSIVIHATVNKSADRNLIQRAGDMHQCVEEVARSLRTQFANEDVFIENTRVVLDTGEGMLSDKEYMLFHIIVTAESYSEVL